MKLPFIHIKNLSLSTSALWELLERTLALFTRTFTMYFIMLLLIQPVTWHGCTDTALRVSVSLQTAAHFCMDLWSSVIRSDFISQVPRITMAKRHCMVTHGMMVGGLMRAKTQTEWKKKEWMCVMVRKGEREMWQSEGGNTIKGNECQSVIPAVWSRCLCQLSWHPEVWSRSPSHWVNARFQCQMLALL